MSEANYRYVFGPVPSRRLGRSLGVDLVPHKTCTYDCTYCQVGRTTVHTADRQAYVPYDDVVAEIQRKLDAGAAPDYVTMSGSGEPTLYADLGRLIDTVKQMTETRVAVITNGSLLWMPEVRDALLRADLVVPSLDAGTPEAFARINRPCGGIGFDEMVEGLVRFREAFPKTIWLEVFLLDGINADEAEVQAIASHVQRIRPDRVQLNTVARPPADQDAKGVPQATMERFAAMFEPKAEVVADFTGAHEDEESETTCDEVLDLLKRRPCSLEDVAQGMRIHRHHAAKHIQHLLEQERIRSELRGDTQYYVAESHGEA
ncbi:MAG: radical SAM protein [bacterium]|nr:radical SAM protein [bacterium]